MTLTRKKTDIYAKLLSDDLETVYMNRNGSLTQAFVRNQLIFIDKLGTILNINGKRKGGTVLYLAEELEQEYNQNK